jgi:hypothetical protein
LILGGATMGLDGCIKNRKMAVSNVITMLIYRGTVAALKNQYARGAYFQNSEYLGAGKHLQIRRGLAVRSLVACIDVVSNLKALDLGKVTSAAQSTVT